MELVSSQARSTPWSLTCVRGIATLLISCLVVVEATPQDLGILDTIRSELTGFPPYSMTLHYQTQISEMHPGGNIIARRSQEHFTEVHRDRTRFRLGIKSRFIDEGQPPREVMLNTLWNGDRFFHWKPRSDERVRAYIGNGKEMAYEQLATGNTGMEFFGFLRGDHEPYYDILSKAEDLNITQDNETVDGCDCLSIEAVGEHGSYELWVDPEHNYQLRKAVLEKRGDDVLWGFPVSYVPPSNITIPGPGGGKTEFTLEFTTEGIAEIEPGVFFPTSASFLQVVSYRSGEKEVSRGSIEIAETVLNPDFDGSGLFDPDIPEGALVSVVELPGLLYEWSSSGTMQPHVLAETLDPRDDSVGGVSPEPLSNESTSQTGTKEIPSDHADQARSKSSDRGEGRYTAISLAGLFLGILLLVGLTQFARRKGAGQTAESRMGERG